jgi:glycosyltransferase involved in cell wall biosynthesis
MPSILFINRVYPPESGATGRVLEYAARGFFDAGWKVSVLTSAGELSKPGVSLQNGVEVVRIGTLFSKDNFILRAAGYAWMIPSFLRRALMLARADVVVTMTDPPMLSVIGPVLKLIKGSALIHWAQDLYPEAAEEFGIFKKEGIISRILGFLSSRSIGAHDLTISVGRCMEDRLVRKGVPASRIRVLTNTGVERDIYPTERGKSLFRERHGIGEEFVVMYSGNMGRAHEFDTIIEAARILKERGERAVLFLFVGSGSEEFSTRQSVERLGLENVRFLPSQPFGNLSESLGMGDLHLVTMRKGMEGVVVPSKFYGVMAAGRPTLFVGSPLSEVGRVIQQQKVGEVISVGDSLGMVSAILNYRDYTARLEEEGSRARELILREDFLPILVEEAVRVSLSQKAPSIN